MYIGLVQSKRCPCQIFTKIEFSRQIFQKNTQTSSLMIISSVVADLTIRTHTHTHTQSRFFRNFANVSKKLLYEFRTTCCCKASTSLRVPNFYSDCHFGSAEASSIHLSDSQRTKHSPRMKPTVIIQ